MKSRLVAKVHALLSDRGAMIACVYGYDGPGIRLITRHKIDRITQVEHAVLTTVELSVRTVAEVPS